MDLNFFVKKIVTQLGLPALSLEKFYPTIKEVLLKDTLPTFSQFFPYIYHMKTHLTLLESDPAFEGTERIYYIRDEYLEKNNIDIIAVDGVTGASSFEEWNATPPTFNVDAMILEGAASNIRSQLNLSTKSFKFLPPNRVRLRGYNGCETVYMSLKIAYPNFGAVPQSLSIEIEKLAKLDVKCWLYPELKLYDKFDTADGQIDLKLDDWENAQKDREELIDEWRTKAFPNTVTHPFNYE